MSITWKSFRERSPKWLRTVALAAVGVAALYIGAIEPMHSARSIAEQKATGLNWAPQSLSRQESFFERSTAPRNQSAGDGLVGGSIQTASMAAPVVAPPHANDSPDRKMVRTDSLDLVVGHPADSAEQIRILAERLGGFMETSQVSGETDMPSATLTIRVPVARFEEARTEIRKLGLRVENERIDAQDVTKQYVDQDARLHNLHAEETQYLGILKQASTVSDTLEVSEKLNEVRGEIEQQQAEFDALTKQTETVSLTISLRAEMDTQVFGLHWRPLYQLKIAVRNGLNGLGDYISAMTSILFYLPAVLLWMGTILIALAAGYRILRRAGRILFAKPKAVVVNG